MWHDSGMTEVRLQELRQNASEVVRRAAAGERLTIIVAGRPAAVLGPVRRNAWRQWEEIVEIFQTPGDEHRAALIESSCLSSSTIMIEQTGESKVSATISEIT